MSTRAKPRGFEIQSVDFRGPYKRPFVQVHALRDGQPYELTCLTPDGLLEVYDQPKSWGGLRRFVGYAPAATTRKLLAMALEWLSARTDAAAAFRRCLGT